MKCQAVQPRLVPLSLLILALVLGAGVIACAQPMAPEMPPMDSNDLIRESALRVHLEDKNGVLVPVPGFTLERFRELQALESRLKEQQAKLPRTIFTSPIELKGKVDGTGEFVQLTAYFHFRLTGQIGVDQPKWTVVPLRLDNAFLDVSAIKHVGKGELFITNEDGGYVCWLEAAPDTSHIVEIPLKARIHATGSLKSLSLQLPDTATSIELDVPDEEFQVSSTDEQVAVSAERQNGRTFIRAEGAGRQMEIAWQLASEASPHKLEATSATTFHIHGNLVRCEAHLTVRSHSEPIDSFVVKLPAEMQVDARRDADFQIIPSLPSSANEPQHVLIKRLAGPTSDPIEVDLKAALPPIKIEKQRRVIQLAGFSVQNTVREWGSVDVALDGNWSPKWTIGQFVQRVAVPNNTNGKAPIAARFLYDRQPYSLRVDLQPKLTQVSLNATYEVKVTPDSLQLHARLEGTTNGADLSELPFQMAGWNVQTITASDNVVDELTANDTGLVALPLDSNTPDFQFQIRAQRDISAEAAEVSFELPRAGLTSLQAAATLVVHSSDNIELTPDPASIRWLSQETRSPSGELSEQVSTPLVYREEMSSESKELAKFVANRRLRPRETSIDVSSVASLDGENAAVRQTLKANVAYEPLTELVVVVPPAILASETLRITRGAELLELEDTTASEGEDAPTAESPAGDVLQPIEATITLDEPIIGSFQIEFNYEISQTAIQSEVGIRIPLVQPLLDETIVRTSNQLTIHADAKTAVSLVDERWIKSSTEPTPPSDIYKLQVHADDVRSDALVQTSVVESRPTGNSSVTRIWIQSWLTMSDRRDRVCLLLNSDQSQVQIQLPSEAQLDQLRVLVAGEAAPIVIDRPEHSIAVSLAEEQIGHDVSLELWYFNDTSDASRFGIALPTIVNASRAERVYWQIVLPRGEHLAWLPATLTPELLWQREQFYWARHGRLEQAELERLVDASSQDALPVDTNRYLFSATGSVDSVGFTKVSRWKLLLIASGATLGVVLPFIYLPAIRTPSVSFIVGIMLFAVAVTYPEYAVLIGQAGAIGLVLGIVGYAMQRFMGRASVQTIPRRGSIYLQPDSNVSAGSIRRSEGSSRATTATAPAHLQVARVEGEL